MRNITTSALEMIQRNDNVEPVVIVKVYWRGFSAPPTAYCDSKYVVEGLVGRLLQMGSVEDVVDITQASSSTSLSITLDDSVGDIKAIFDQTDIHKLYVEVQQWFTGLPLSDAFTLFEGQISTPITWSEGERTLSFDVVSVIEDLEVGYSLEEMNVPAIPVQLIGQTIPVVFGTVIGLKAIPLNLTPSIILSNGFGMVDSLQWEVELANLAAQSKQAYDNSRSAWQSGIAEALIASRYKSAFADIGSIDEFGFSNDPAQADQHDQAAQDYFRQSSKYMEEKIKIDLDIVQRQNEFEAQQRISIDVSLPSAEFVNGEIVYKDANGNITDNHPADGGSLPFPVRIHYQNFPQGQPFYAFRGQFNNYVGDFLTTGGATPQLVSVTNISLLTDTKIKVGTVAYNFAVPQGAVFDEFNRVGQQPKFVWVDGGTEVKIFSYPRLFYIGYNIGSLRNVWANSKYGRRVVPPNYYQFIPGSGPVPAQLLFPVPLEAYDGEWQSGSVEVDVVGVTTNAIDVMAYAIENFSTLEVDSASFIATRPTVFNCNFALTSRMNVVQFLKEVAYQSRCAIWMKRKRVYVKNLAYASPSTAIITDDDVEVNSLVITTTPTEQIITKYVAEWRYNYNEPNNNEVILRYNMLKYGKVEERYNYFIYNQYEFVAKAAEFWMNRLSNTWKLCSFKVNLNHLRIETFDTITLQFNEKLLSTNAVDCIVQKAVFNSDDDSITIECWVPIRLGEMVPYAHAFPGTTQAIFPDQNDPNIQTGNPLDGISFPPIPVSFPAQWSYTTRRAGTRGYSSGSYEVDSVIPGDTTPQPLPSTTVLSPEEERIALRAIDKAYDLAQTNNKQDRKISPISKPSFTAASASAYFGRVISQRTDEDTGTIIVKCYVFTNGLFQPATEKEIYVIDLLEGQLLPVGMPLVVNRTVLTVADPSGQIDPDTKRVRTVTKSEYWAQPPIWMPTPAIEEVP